MILTQYPSTQDAISAVETNLIAFVAFTAELQFFSRAAGCPSVELVQTIKSLL